MRLMRFPGPYTNNARFIFPQNEELQDTHENYKKEAEQRCLVANKKVRDGKMDFYSCDSPMCSNNL